MIGKIFNPEVVLFETNTFAKSFTQELKTVSDLNVHDFTTTRKRKQEIILNLQMNFENGKIRLPYGNEESRRVTSTLIEELSMFAITESGRFEGIGAHDDMVMSLALANAATHTLSEKFIHLDDLGIFDDKPIAPKPFAGRGIMGLNFWGDIMSWKNILKDEPFDDFRFNMSSMHQEMLQKEKEMVIKDAQFEIEKLLDYKDKLLQYKQNERLDKFVDADLPLRPLDNVIAAINKWISSMEDNMGMWYYGGLER